MKENIWPIFQMLIITSLSFVTALAWNSAFQNLFEHIPFLKRGGPWVYAILLTLMVIVVTSLLKRKEKTEEGSS